MSLLKYLSLSGEPWPDCGQDGWDADDEEIQSPPATHLVAAVDDLTDMLDYDSEDIDGMDDDADEEQNQNPPFTGRWTATSSYDVYMVDTPKKPNDDDKEDPVEDKPPEIQPKHQRQRCHSKPRRGKNSSTGTGENNTSDDAEDNKDPVEPTSEQNEREDGRVSPNE